MSSFCIALCFNTTGAEISLVNTIHFLFNIDSLNSAPDARVAREKVFFFRLLKLCAIIGESHTLAVTPLHHRPHYATDLPRPLHTVPHRMQRGADANCPAANASRS